MQERRILVTGGAGYVGSHLTRLLLERGYRVRILDKLAWGRESIRELASDPRFELYEGDIRHIEDLVAAFQDCHGVVHLAGIVGDPACAIDPDNTFAVNLEATRAIVDVARYREVERFVFASTCSVYGAAEDQWINEGSLLNPVSLYAETNLQSERIILEGLRDGPTLPTVLRFGTVYGLSERMRFDLVVNIMTAKAVVEGRVAVYGGEQWRPNVHAHDAARAAICALEADPARAAGEIFNVGSNHQNHRVEALGRLVAAQIPGAVVQLHEEAPDRRSYRVAFDKIERVLGFACERKIEDGVREIAAALRSGRIPDYRADHHYNVRYDYR